MKSTIFNFHTSGSKMAIILFSRIWGVLIGIGLLPIYIKLIGTESYGLIAFYSTLAGALAILDLGLSASITRQVAIMKTQIGKEINLLNLVFSIELLNWIIAITIGILIIALSHPISIYWLRSNSISVESIRKSIMLMGVLFAFQFPSSVYDGVMIGLQKQIANALINILFTTVKAAGVILMLKLVSPTVECYFVWQASVTLLFTLFLRFYVKAKVAYGKVSARFSIGELRNIWKFAAGMTSISLVTFFLSQIDKLVVSKMLTLDFVGYYSLAFMVAGSIGMIISAVQPVIYPKFTTLIAENNNSGVVDLYHRTCKWVAIIVFPIGFALIFFAKDILHFWTSNDVITLNTLPILQVCVAGSVINAIVAISYIFTISNGNTKMGLYLNLIASIILVPLLFWWTSKYGALGASYVWLVLNLGYLIFWLPFFHTNYLKGELINFFVNDLARPFILSGLIFFSAKIFELNITRDMNLGYFCLLLIFSSILYVMIIPELREYGTKLVKIIFRRNS